MLILQDVVFDQENWKMFHVSGPAEGLNCKYSTWKHFFVSSTVKNPFKYHKNVLQVIDCEVGKTEPETEWNVTVLHQSWF